MATFHNLIQVGGLVIVCLVFVAHAESEPDEPVASGESTPVQCDESEFKCADGNVCTRLSYRCDGDKDCTDGSDDSVELCKDNCLGLEDRFQCKDGSCVMARHVCTGSPQCPDGSDEGEELCGDCNGNKEKFKCAGSGKCIIGSFTCDSDLDCGEDDPSDEDPKICDANCGGHEGRFQCANKKCIYESGVCNGRDNCGDNSDESEAICANCNGATNRTRCKESFKCFSEVVDRCDGWKDCAIRNENGDIVTEDDTDEENCPGREEVEEVDNDVPVTDVPTVLENDASPEEAGAGPNDAPPEVGEE